MVYFEKTYPAPFSLAEESEKNNGSYRKEDVLNQLTNDFYNKCYICESKDIESINIEHFAPHQDSNKIRKFNWSNLFWACNQIKSNKESFLNSIVKEDNVDRNIRYYIDDDLATNKIVIEARVNSLEVNNSVELLNDVYSGTTDMNKFQARTKRNKLYDEVCDFMNFIQKYMRTEENREKLRLLDVIKSELSNQSAFTAFKRWIIRDNPKLMEEFQQYIGD